MKMFFLILSLIVFGNNVFPQTKEIELKVMATKYKLGDYSQTEYRDLGKKWNNLLNDIGGYPELPYKENGTIEYEFVLNFNDLTKAIIYNRIKEWTAINFGSLKAVLHYENFESGKIILKGSFNIPVSYDYKNFWGTQKEAYTEGKCYQTYIFTIKDKKLKIQITDFRYEVRISFYSASTNTFTNTTKEYSIYDVFPVILQNQLRWKEYLTMLKSTSTKINKLVRSMESYNKSYNQDYSF